MHSQYNPEQSIDNRVWTRLPNDQFAWLKPSSDAGEPDDALFVVTELGRRELAVEALFGPCRGKRR